MRLACVFLIGVLLSMAGCNSHLAPPGEVTDPGPEAGGPESGSPDAAAPDASTDAGPTGPQTEVVPACTQVATLVKAGVTSFVGGGGTLAYELDGGIWVLPASSQTATRVMSSANIRYLDVAGDYLLLTTDDPVTESVNITTGATAQLGSAAWASGPAACLGHAFVWSSSANWETSYLWAGPVDGSAPMTLLLTESWSAPVQCDGASAAWVDGAGALWTMPAAGGTMTQHPVTIGNGSSFALNGDTLYYAVMGPPGADNFRPFTLVSESIDGGPTTTIATSLPENYPGSGTQDNGPFGPVVGPKHLFWTEFWGNGGDPTLINWVLRETAPGETPRTIDSFTWTAQSATTGTQPGLAADGTAVYWTHEGALMRLCE
jgi:hypothetical protein